MFKKSFILLACAILIPCSLSSAQSGVSEYGSGVHQYFSGRHQTAISTLNDAIAADSKNARAYYFRGLAKMGSGDSYGAKSDFEMGALVEASSSKTRTSLVTRSLERVQGGLRLEIEKTRKRVFAGGISTGGSSTVIASSIPVQSFPVQSFPIQSHPVVSTYSEVVPQSFPQTTGLVTYDAPVPLPVYSAPITPAPAPVFSAPIVFEQPQVISSEPIGLPFEQQIISGSSIQPSTFTNPTTLDPAIVINPAPGESVFGSDTPIATSVVETPSEEPEMASDTTPEPEPMTKTVTAEEAEEAVDVDAFAAASSEPAEFETVSDEPIMASKEMAKEEAADAFAAATEEAEMPAEFGGVAETAAATEDPFGAASAEPADTQDIFGGAAKAEMEPVNAASAVETADAQSSQPQDVFGSAGTAEVPVDQNVVGAAGELPNDPFGAVTAEPAVAEDVFGGAAAEAMPVETGGGSDPFGAATTESTEAPFGASDTAPTEDPFGAGASEPKPPAADPFGTGAPEAEPPTADPFGAGGPEAEPPAADPFGAGGPEAEPPTADPFGAGGGEPEAVDDPFGV